MSAATFQQATFGVHSVHPGNPDREQGTALKGEVPLPVGSHIVIRDRDPTQLGDTWVNSTE